MIPSPSIVDKADIYLWFYLLRGRLSTIIYRITTGVKIDK